MNYYANNRVEVVEYHQPIVVKPMMMDYIGFPDKAHDSLERCQECNIKYDYHLLQRINIGKFVCKFCLNGAA